MQGSGVDPSGVANRAKPQVLTVSRHDGWLICNNQDKTTMSTSEMIKKMKDIHKKYILYASPSVIISFSDYFQYLYSTNETTHPVETKKLFIHLSKIMIEMRKDLGLINRKLGKNGELLFRSMFTDYDRIINEQKK